MRGGLGVFRYYENENYPLGNGYRPPNGDYSSQNYRPVIGTNGRPILIGPVPSWENDNNDRYKDYNVCKCVYSFNCNTPGIKFVSREKKTLIIPNRKFSFFLCWY